MGGSSSKSESESESGFKQDVWGPQGSALQNLYGAVGNLFGQTVGGMQGQIPGAVNWMQGINQQMTPYWQQQMGGGAYQGMDLQGMYRDALGGGGNEQAMNEMIMGGAGNDYVDAMRGQLQADAASRLGGQLAMNDLRAAQAGQSGSSRHGITESALHSGAADRLARQQTKLGYDTFDADLQRKLDIARRADQYDMNRLRNVGDMLGQQQAAMSGGLGFGQNMQQMGLGAFSPYMMPWQAAGMYGNIIGRPTILGSGNMSGSSDSKGISGGYFG